MIKVGIYNPYLLTLGGGEKYTLAIAEYLQHKCQVDYLSHVTISKASLEARFNFKLEKVCFKQIRPPKKHPWHHGFWLQRVAANIGHANTMSEFTKDYDVFFCNSNEIPVFNRAKMGVWLIHCPFFPYLSKEGLSWFRKSIFPFLKGRSIFDMAALKSYCLHYTSSEFTAGWLRKVWGVPVRVLYPFCDVPLLQSETKKKTMILGVARFSKKLHAKRQDILVETFKQCRNLHQSGWELHLCGGLSDDDEDKIYFDELMSCSKGYPIYFHPNASYGELTHLYEQSAIFWHAAGFGANLEKEPWKLEHFGITPIEAMRAGVVPMVYGQGGPAETVEDEISGFHWFSTEELMQKTCQVTQLSSEKLAVIRSNLKKRSDDFSKAKFFEQLDKLFETKLGLSF